MTVTGPSIVSQTTLTGPVCLTVTGTTGAVQLDVLSGPSDLRVSRVGQEPATYCFHIPQGFTGGITLRIGDGNGTRLQAIIVLP